MYTYFAKNFLFPFGCFILRNSIYKNFKFLEKSQWKTRDEIEEIQLKKLKGLLSHSYKNVPLYRNIFLKSKIMPKDIKKIDDLKNLPPISKDDLKNFKMSTAKNIPKNLWLSNHTSGSTGTPFQYKTSRESMHWRFAAKLRNNRWYGLEIGSPYIKIWGEKEKQNFSLSSFFTRNLMRCKQFPALGLTEKEFMKYYNYIKKSSVKVLEGYASAIYLLARYMQEHDLELYLDAVVCSGETLIERKLLENVFNCQIFDRYGSREFSNIAHECEEHNGMHINSENLIVEFSKKEGILITDLTNYVMPFIRYKINDMGIGIKKECKCGRGLPLMKIVGGRLPDIIITPSGKHLIVHFFTLLFGKINTVKKFQVVQNKKNSIVIYIVGFLKNENFILEKIQKYAGDDMNIKIKYVSDIKQTRSGKYRFIKSLLG